MLGINLGINHKKNTSATCGTYCSTRYVGLRTCECFWGFAVLHENSAHLDAGRGRRAAICVHRAVSESMHVCCGGSWSGDDVVKVCLTKVVAFVQVEGTAVYIWPSDGLRIRQKQLQTRVETVEQ